MTAQARRPGQPPCTSSGTAQGGHRPADTIAHLATSIPNSLNDLVRTLADGTP
jgi:hypothetical protein